MRTIHSLEAQRRLAEMKNAPANQERNIKSVMEQVVMSDIKCESNNLHDGDNYCANCSTCHDCLAENTLSDYKKIKALTQQVAELRAALSEISNRANLGSAECSGDGYHLACDVLDLSEEALKESE